MIIKSVIPYSFTDDGFDWSLISVKNDFSKINDTLDYATYENQYGHFKSLTLNELKSLKNDRTI